jgi:RimJ/RimL family protein N-acetyltransferase
VICRALTPKQQVFLIDAAAKKMSVSAEEIIAERPTCIMAAVRNDVIVGIVIYSNQRGRSIDVHMAGDTGWVTKGNLRAIFSYAFKENDFRRVNAWIHRKNKKARKFAEGLGFVLEGVKRKGCGDGADAILYGMLAQECRWI